MHKINGRTRHIQAAAAGHSLVQSRLGWRPVAWAVSWALAAGAAQADVYEWHGPARNNWNDAGAWLVRGAQASGPPDITDTLYIRRAGPLVAKSDADGHQVFVGGTNGTLDIEGKLKLVRHGLSSAGGNLNLGLGSGSQGTARLKGKEALLDVYFVEMGQQGSLGVLKASEGARADVSVIAALTGGSGQVHADGAGTVVRVGTVELERDSALSIFLSDGATLQGNDHRSWISVFEPGGRLDIHIGGPAGIATMATKPGHIEMGSVRMIAGQDSSIHFNHTDTSGQYVFSPQLQGAGKLYFYKGTTTLTADSGQFAGQVEVRKDGWLKLNGSLANSDVRVWGRLSGTERVGNVTLETGGELDPGNSIGTLRIRGNLTMRPDAVYRAEINGRASDLIEVGGRAVLDNTDFLILRDEDDPTPVLPGTVHTLLTAGNGLTVAHPDLLTHDFVFQDLSLRHDSRRLTLHTARNAVPFSHYATSPNQRAVAQALDGAPSSAPLWQRMVSSGANDARTMLAGLSGGAAHASVAATLGEQALRAHDVVREQLSRTQASGASMWAQAVGRRARVADDTASRVRHDMGGLLAGVQFASDAGWQAGLAAGYTDGRHRIPGHQANADSRSWLLSAHARVATGPWALSGGLAYSWHDVSGHRTAVWPGAAQRLSSDYRARTMQAFVDAEYRFALGEQGYLAPFVRFTHADTRSRHLRESGGDAALAGRSRARSQFATLGLRWQGQVSAPLAIHAELGWRHALGQRTGYATLYPVIDGTTMRLDGVRAARDALSAQLALRYEASPRTSLSLSYSGLLGAGVRDHGLQAGVAWRF